MNNQQVYSNVLKHLETFSNNKNNYEWYKELNRIIKKHSTEPMLYTNFGKVFKYNKNPLTSIAEYIDNLIKSRIPKDSILAAKKLADRKLKFVGTTYISSIGHCIHPDHFVIIKNWALSAPYYLSYFIKIDSGGVLNVNQYIILLAIMNSTPMPKRYSFENLSEQLSNEAKFTQNAKKPQNTINRTRKDNYIDQNQSLLNDKYFNSILEKFKSAIENNLSIENILDIISDLTTAEDKQKTTQATKTKETYTRRKIDEKNWIDNENSLEALEGNEKKVIRSVRERNSTLPNKIKEKRLRIEGKLQCEVCKFDFSDFYGEIGKDFIEAHHKIEISQLTESTQISESDFNLICSNCHRMIHSTKPCLTVEELKEMIKKS